MVGRFVILESCMASLTLCCRSRLLATLPGRQGAPGSDNTAAPWRLQGLLEIQLLFLQFPTGLFSFTPSLAGPPSDGTMATMVRLWSSPRSA
ncbi:hypothetical protein BGZ61DRAFT_464963 [Ilyonectria robusta]|uniref:uncharacterized protein n=1 Tax=Ilyonectria robusta TaxID=1079257 RepID=UPI001E8DE4ED|nr:uncharacterized protein BGZ61DRAFT_464963 [Ilyonectria robusta]KAH8659713.1 hypothetical protein BGZ61DRAFT_464963 [Ilyonectria robusta]